MLLIRTGMYQNKNNNKIDTSLNNKYVKTAVTADALN